MSNLGRHVGIPMGEGSQQDGQLTGEQWEFTMAPRAGSCAHDFIQAERHDKPANVI